MTVTMEEQAVEIPQETKEKTEDELKKEIKDFFRSHAPKDSFFSDIKDVGWPMKRYRINWWNRSEEKGSFISKSYYIVVQINENNENYFEISYGKPNLTN
jgi:hypothetical protein